MKNRKIKLLQTSLAMVLLLAVWVPFPALAVESISIKDVRSIDNHVRFTVQNAENSCVAVVAAYASNGRMEQAVLVSVVPDKTNYTAVFDHISTKYKVMLIDENGRPLCGAADVIEDSGGIELPLI